MRDCGTQERSGGERGQVQGTELELRVQERRLDKGRGEEREKGEMRAEMERVARGEARQKGKYESSLRGS